MKYILTSLLFVLTYAAHAQNRADVSETKSNTEAMPTLETTQEKRQNISKGFRGESLVSLVNKYELFAKSSKDEFTKTANHKAEIAALRDKPYRFIISTKMNEGRDKNYKNIAAVRYDADAEVMLINLWTSNEDFVLNRDKSSSSYQSPPNYSTIKIEEVVKSYAYIGQNGYGAKAKISSTLLKEFGLAIANIKLKDKSEIFSLSLPIKPREAKILKDDLSFYINVDLTSSDAVKDDILKIAQGHGATVSNPYEFYLSGQYILANLKEAGVYKKSSGEVLGWKKFE